ncbi:RHS repeat-associated core domain-containing protein [Treponema sp. OMZ 789]|nr:RHS repeat-associated core domain-containing protein [Treponema sp. OMZ 789]UTC69305.1 RHS repeat-associated core domain-containing protein [Treponema sp. OMZ 790]UTC72019.1 RHS repeat-associated core domain-containing protein [Treponema sp. OMZ 791]
MRLFIFLSSAFCGTSAGYNRYRYYDPSTGTYISRDTIGLAGGLNAYAYVHDSNSWIDVLGLTGTYMFTDGKTWYIGKGPEDRMYASMKERVGGKANVTQGIYVYYGNNQTGLMVEA